MPQVPDDVPPGGEDCPRGYVPYGQRDGGGPRFCVTPELREHVHDVEQRLRLQRGELIAHQFQLEAALAECRRNCASFLDAFEHDMAEVRRVFIEKMRSLQQQHQDKSAELEACRRELQQRESELQDEASRTQDREERIRQLEQQIQELETQLEEAGAAWEAREGDLRQELEQVQGALQERERQLEESRRSLELERERFQQQERIIREASEANAAKARSELRALSAQLRDVTRQREEDSRNPAGAGPPPDRPLFSPARASGSAMGSEYVTRRLAAIYTALTGGGGDDFARGLSPEEQRRRLNAVEAEVHLDPPYPYRPFPPYSYRYPYWDPYPYPYRYSYPFGSSLGYGRTLGGPVTPYGGPKANLVGVSDATTGGMYPWW